METRDDDDVTTPAPAPAPAPPDWALRTPIRPHEVWTLPALALVLAAGFVALGVLFGGVLAFVVGIVAAAIATAVAITLAVTGWSAYAEQTRGASWRHHVALIVSGVTLAVVAALAGLLVAGSIGVSVGLLVGVPSAFRFARVVPRFDHLAVAWATVAFASGCAVLVLLGLVVPELPEYRAGAWVGVGAVLAAFSIVVAAVEFRRAARSPRD
ncbi:hypothetical protein [Curtobacterium pusillum]|uniref:hypothetical protein n=1 Tax=Curtobacterium pusillum TaxID=69373 RepID=UPI0011A84585|nr:hypothetical protein [Curtobacterium pusillum]